MDEQERVQRDSGAWTSFQLYGDIGRMLKHQKSRSNSKHDHSKMGI